MMPDMDLQDEEAKTPASDKRLPIMRRRKVWRSVAALGLGVLLLVLIFDTFRASQPRLSPNEVSTVVARVLASATPAPSVASQVYQQVRPSVVLIETYPDKNSDKPDGEGTGVIVDASGLILTAQHVIDGAARVKVTFADGNETDATIVSQQPERDTAVLQVPDLPPLIMPAVMGDPGSLQIGDEAIVIGNPFGLVGSLSAGSISGLERTFVTTDTHRALSNLIQFDAPVNPGNSGGPLLNRNGEVVGIVTGLVNPTKDDVFIGIGFAVPITAAASGMGESPF